MNFLLLLQIFVVLMSNINALEIENDKPVLTNVRIYSNLAEIIQPLGKLPLEFSNQDWSMIRSDTITLLGSDVNVTRITITEKKPSLNNNTIYVRSPTSTPTNKKFVKATMIDESSKLVKLIDNDIGKEPLFFTVSSNDILNIVEPPKSKYYVNFTYDAIDTVYLSYLRSNLNWKTLSIKSI
jgi:hypothetical protein